MAKKERPKTRFSTKLYAWFAFLSAIFAIFIFWTNRGEGANKTNIFVGAAAIAISIFFALVTFIRFIRSRSILGGLFMTTCISTGVFLGTSQMLPVFVPPTVAALNIGNGVDAAGNSFQLLIVLSQVGLFALWFGFLLFTIYLYVQPVKRIEKTLAKIADGENVSKIKIGRARQYKEIESQIRELNARCRYTRPEENRQLLSSSEQ